MIEKIIEGIKKDKKGFILKALAFGITGVGLVLVLKSVKTGHVDIIDPEVLEDLLEEVGSDI